MTDKYLDSLGLNERQKKAVEYLRKKAKDELGRESEWSTLEVSMPKSKSYLSLFEERFPFLFNLLSFFL
jgi:hypothetical protein